MSATVASIAQEAFDAVAAEIGGVIQSFTLTRQSGGSVDRVTDTYTPGTTTDTGRVVFADERAAQTVFPGLVLAQQQQAIFMIELSTLAPPKQHDRVTVNSEVFTIERTVDVVRGGGLWAAIVAEA